ncbi:hypothetical protein O9992_05265 [Vibrio lentus]|nr:hypothetical protein [Vibrio lentus]
MFDRGLFEDVSDIWTDNNMKQDFAAAAPAMTVQGKQFDCAIRITNGVTLLP